MNTVANIGECKRVCDKSNAMGFHKRFMLDAPLERKRIN